MRKWIADKVLTLLSYMFRLIGIDVVFATIYTKELNKLEEQINAYININKD